MTQSATLEEAEPKPIDSSFMLRVFYGFAALALLSLAISAGGKWFGKSIAMAGHTDDGTIHEVVIGNDVIAAPANMIRFERARRDGIAERLDLYLHWPDMRGYSAAARDDFNHAQGARRILFLTFEQRMMSRDMSGRFEPIYKALIDGPGTAEKGGIRLYRFKENSGYLNEVLAVAPQAGALPFVARCLIGANAAESLAPCERDIHVGGNLSVTYRFARDLLPDWRALDQQVIGKVRSLVRTGR